MSLKQPTRHYRINNWSIELMQKPWWVDVMTGGVVLAWMGWTFATMQQFGPSLDLLIPALIIGLVGILLIYGQRVTYLQIGDKFVLGMDSGPYGERKSEDERDQYR